MRNETMNFEKTLTLKDGRILGFAEYGDLRGAPIFYFHGFPGSRLEASCFQDIAHSHGWRLIGVDRPGMGLSSLDSKRTLLSWAQDVTYLADSLRIERFSVIGHSGGGAFVVACAHTIPERLIGAAIVSGIAPLP